MIFDSNSENIAHAEWKKYVNLDLIKWVNLKQIKKTEIAS